MYLEFNQIRYIIRNISSKNVLGSSSTSRYNRYHSHGRTSQRSEVQNLSSPSYARSNDPWYCECIVTAFVVIVLVLWPLCAYIYLTVEAIKFLISIPVFVWIVFGILILFIIFAICCYKILGTCLKYVPKCYEICCHKISNTGRLIKKTIMRKTKKKVKKNKLVRRYIMC